MAIAGVLMVLVVLLLRPQEFVPALGSARLLYVVTGLAVAGVAAEATLGGRRLSWGPQVPWLLALLAWCMLVTVRRLGVEGLTVAWEAVGLSAVVMLVVVLAAGTPGRWRAVVALLLTSGAGIAGVCIHQSRQPAQCIAMDISGLGGDRSGEGTPDGRPCDTEYACEEQGQRGTLYACEKAGLFDTFTEGRRVRWRGTLGDPNELALLLGALTPLGLALAAEAARARRLLLWTAVAGALGLYAWCVVLTGSRGGQLVVLTVLVATVVRRHGLRGALLGAALALPVLVLGGRAGEEAESSSLERLDLLHEGLAMVREHPLLGVGVGQFLDHASGERTAHNAYLLAAAELGLPGYLLWTTLFYASMKIPWVVARDEALDPRLRTMGSALVVAFAGLGVGVFFLSFCYKAVLFVFFGLSGALLAAARVGRPEFAVRVTAPEVARVGLAAAALLAAVLGYTHAALGHGS